MKKFVASTKDIKAGVDILDTDFQLTVQRFMAEDSENALADAVDYYITEAMQLNEKTIAVVSDDLAVAESIASVLNNEYKKEMELMKEANIVKEEVSELVEASIKAGKVSVDEDKNAAARAFLEENGAAIVNSKKSTKKEEKEMETKTKVTGRRRIATGAAKQEETKTNEKVETEMTNRKATINEEVKVSGTRRRVSSAKKEETTVESKVAAGRKRIKRGTSLRGTGFQKHEGYWFSNTGLYEGLKHLDSIVDSYDEETGYFTCPELGLDTIVFVEPTEISRYRNRTDIDVVLQIKSAGSVFEYPIKEASSNAKAPLSCSSIGWVEYNGKVSPRFGFWRPNALEVTMSCGCGNKFKANTGNVYCPKCKTRHDDVEVSVEHGSLDFAGDIEGWVFQELPNVVVPKDVLAIVMCLAHWEAGYEIDGLLEEDAE